MTLLHRVASIFKWIVRRNAAEQQLDDELCGYIEMSAAERMREGVAPDEARRLARMELGGIEQTKEHVRTKRHGHLSDEVGRDLRYGLRLLVRHPGFTSVILLTLALGIGTNTAIFSLIDALMLRSLPVSHPQELVLVNLRSRTEPGSGGESLSYATVRALDRQRGIFSGVGGFTGMSFDVGTPGAVTRVPGGLVTGSFYQTLGLQPSAGRLLAPEDDEAGAPLVAVIGDGYWERHFERSPDVIGHTVLLNGVPVTVVGVTPRGFEGANVGQIADITIAAAALPIVRPAMAGLIGPGNSWLRVLARPAIGVGATEAASRLNRLWPALSASVIVPNWPAARRKEMSEAVFVLEPGATGWTYLRDMYQKPLLILQAVAGLVLLIACANVASLFLARASVRRREIAVRLAIGAGRGRIVRQLLIEGLLLSFGGAAIGSGVAWLSGRLLMALISTGPFQVVLDLTPNWHVLLFSAGLATVTGAVFGVAPALQTRRAEPSLVLKSDDRTSTRRSRLLPVLVALQVAMSLVLVAGAGLFIRTLNNLRHVDAGFSTDRVFVVDLERGVGPSPAALLDAVRRVPGVESAGVATHTPLDGSSWSEAIVPWGQPMPEKDNARIIGIGPEFLGTLQVPFVAGRDLNAGDTAGRPAVAIINERYARRYFANQNAIGRHLVSSLMGQAADLEIIGVVKDTIASGLRRQPPPIVYVSFDQFGSQQTPSLAIRTSGASAGVADTVRGVLQAQMPTLPIEMLPLGAQVNATIVQERMVATLAGGFGVLALVLSSVGLYGLLAYRVARGSRDIGIRMALGARGAGVLARVLLDGARLVAVGVAIGLPAAWAASRAVSSMLFGLGPTDPATIAAAIGVLAGAALLASYVPARRASRVDPLVALRHD